MPVIPPTLRRLASSVGNPLANPVSGCESNDQSDYRSSRPLSSPSQNPLATADAVENLRRERAEIFPDQKKESAVAFLVATVAYFRSLGARRERRETRRAVRRGTAPQ
jgi:hypothetical protein